MADWPAVLPAGSNERTAVLFPSRTFSNRVGGCHSGPHDASVLAKSRAFPVELPTVYSLFALHLELDVSFAQTHAVFSLLLRTKYAFTCSSLFFATEFQVHPQQLHSLHPTLHPSSTNIISRIALNTSNWPHASGKLLDQRHFFRCSTTSNTKSNAQYQTNTKPNKRHPMCVCGRFDQFRGFFSPSWVFLSSIFCLAESGLRLPFHCLGGCVPLSPLYPSKHLPHPVSAWQRFFPRKFEALQSDSEWRATARECLPYANECGSQECLRPIQAQ